MHSGKADILFRYSYSAFGHTSYLYSEEDMLYYSGLSVLHLY